MYCRSALGHRRSSWFYSCFWTVFHFPFLSVDGHYAAHNRMYITAHHVVFAHFEAPPSWDCEHIPTNSLRCFWLAVLDFRATLMSRQNAERPTDRTHWHYPFPSCLCRFDHSKSDMNEVYIFISEWEAHKYLWNPTNPKYTNRPGWRGKIHIVGKLSTYLNYCVVLANRNCLFLEHIEL